MLKKRKSGVECLRLLIMFGIVISHWGGHGNASVSSNYDNVFNLIWMQLSQYFGEVSNCAFVLISGYFSSSRTTVNIKGIRNIVIDVKFYSLLMFIIAVILGKQILTIKTGILALFPIIFSQYWFVIPFLFVCLIGPWLNDIVRKLDTKGVIYFYGLQFIAILLLPIIGNASVASNITLFIFYYSIGAGLSIHNGKFRFIERNKYTLALMGFLSAIFLCYAIDYIGNPLIFNRLIGRFSPIPLLTALGLLYIFLKFDFSSGFVNKLALSTFSVYLISENANIYPWLWKDYFDNAAYIDSPYLITISLLHCLVVFVACILIDQVYRLLRNLLETRGLLNGKQ